MGEAAQFPHLVRFQSFEVNLRSGELFKDGEKIKLADQSLQILAMLLEHPGEVVLRTDIQTKLWPNDTVVEFENSINAAVKRLRLALGDSATSPQYVETLARRGYRWLVPVERTENGSLQPQAFVPPSTSAPAPARKSLWLLILVPLAAVLIWIVVRPSFRPVSAKHLTEQDTILLADFVNSTGDAVFDDTLKQALKSTLQQSPSITILSNARISKALTLMTRPPNTPLTPALARELCEREQSKVYVSGAIAALGSDYVIALKAFDCSTGQVVAQQQVTAEGKDKVLNSLSRAALKLREDLGESLVTVSKFDVPLDQSTPSLEALQQYNVAMKAGDQDIAGSLPGFLRAIQLDPDFSMAYLGAGETYANLNQGARAVEYLAKAFQLRDHANPREKLEIESQYYGYATGELDKAVQTYQKTIENYPRSPAPYGNLSVAYSRQGNYEKALDLARQVLQVYPPFGGEAYEGIAEDLLPLQRYDEARQVLNSAVTKSLDIDGVHKDLYALAFVSGDAHAMSTEAAWLESKPEYANLGFELESDTEAFAGHLPKARVLSDRAVNTGLHSDNKEAAALWRANTALREALLGNDLQASRFAAEALKLAPAFQYVEIESALAFAMAGDKARARSLEHDLNKRFPLDTLVQTVWLPTIDAQLSLQDKNPESAVTRLQAVTTVELGSFPFVTNVSCMFAVYERGQAYLATQDGTAAAKEFQKLLDHPGIVWNCPTGALAYLGIARANAIQARQEQGAAADAARTRARTAYKDFLTRWKEADPEIPILKQAKAESAKLN